MKIILKGPKTNWFDSKTWVRMWARLFKFEDDWERISDIEEAWDETFVGRHQLKLTRWYNNRTWWNAKPDVIQIDGWDVWNMDTTLSYIIHAMLLRLKEDKHGAPHVDPEDVPDDLQPKEKPSNENGYTDDTWHDRWEWVLDEMIWTFENLPKDEHDVPGLTSGKHDIQFKDVELENGEKVFQMVKGPNDTYERDEDAIKAWRARRQRGLELFAKYYGGLWD